jgi:hypothetical protein
MQIKAMVRFHSLLLEWPSSRKQATTNVGKDVEKKEPSYTVDVNVN